MVDSHFSPLLDRGLKWPPLKIIDTTEPPVHCAAAKAEARQPVADAVTLELQLPPGAGQWGSGTMERGAMEMAGYWLCASE